MTLNFNKNTVDKKVEFLCNLKRVISDNDYLKRTFVEKSNKIGPWLEKQLEAVIEIGLLTEESEKQIARLNEIRSNVSKVDPILIESFFETLKALKLGL